MALQLTLATDFGSEACCCGPTASRRPRRQPDGEEASSPTAGLAPTLERDPTAAANHLATFQTTAATAEVERGDHRQLPENEMTVAAADCAESLKTSAMLHAPNVASGVKRFDGISRRRRSSRRVGTATCA
jgi:hypothetical protein